MCADALSQIAAFTEEARAVLVRARRLEEREHVLIIPRPALCSLIERDPQAAIACLAELVADEEAVQGLVLTALLPGAGGKAAVLVLRCDAAVDGGPLATSFSQLAAQEGPLDPVEDARDALLALTGCCLQDVEHPNTPRDPPPIWALHDARGRTRFSVCVETRDGCAHPLIPAGSTLPAAGQAVLTTSMDAMDHFSVKLRCGVRPMASGCKLLCSLGIGLTHKQPRGAAQVHLQVAATHKQLFVRLRDVETGRVIIHRVGEQPLSACGEGECEGSQLAARAIGTLLPDVWRWQSPYIVQPPLGRCCIGGRLIRFPVDPCTSLPSTSTTAAVMSPLILNRSVEGAVDIGPFNEVPSKSALTQSGDVDPASTAAKVWPGAWMLATHVERLGRRLHHANVLELGAGCGLPGLVAHTVGAQHVCLTDLESNLPRLRDACKVNRISPLESVGTEVGGDALSHGLVSVVELDWQASLPPSISNRRWDYILAADCVFWTQLFDPLLSTLSNLWLASCARNHADDDVEAGEKATVEGNFGGEGRSVGSGLAISQGRCDSDIPNNQNRLRNVAAPVIILTMTNRLGRADSFCAQAVATGWLVETVETDRAVPHPTYVLRLERSVLRDAASTTR